MPETATEKPKEDRFGGDQFPIHYEGGNLRVFTNPAGELFVVDILSGATIRISSYRHPKGGLEFTTDALVEPIRVTNMIGWRVGPR
ncbi:MAG: hypothetical protein HYY55_01265 [Candidatus Niyogibacteria bacterium]|nr:MAG: hypothetical protein HYY55_01265 [Candidatus Niyogibacteria bacterium]